MLHTFRPREFGLSSAQRLEEGATMRVKTSSSRGRMPSGGPNPVDVHVGSRVRLRRTLLGMSQEKLGEAIALPFSRSRNMSAARTGLAAAGFSTSPVSLMCRSRFSSTICRTRPKN
ncbi:hypothetical protein MCP1_10152 [Candidatus Terasakiella magnetica]|nr:hypothetical protein MCP1_10152 [Candidatus Terasakiella magnetica]